MKKLLSKRVIGSTALVLLALFLVRPQSGLLHRKVADSLSTELGRRVEIAGVHIRFLPRPGLELENLTIYDNPAFGADASGNPLPTGALDGHWMQVLNQLAGVAIAWCISAVGTIILLVAVDKTIGLRVSPEDEREGLDLSQHGEEGYDFNS